MFLFKEAKLRSLSYFKFPHHFLFFKVFIWFWLTVIGTMGALFFLSSLATNSVSNKPLHGPMQKNLIYTAKVIERGTHKHNKSLADVLNHPKLAKRKLLYLSSEQSQDSLTSQKVPNDIDLSLLNFTKSMPAQIIFTEKYQAFGPVKVNVPEGGFYLYEIDVNHRPPFSIRLKLLPDWLKVMIALIASLTLSFIFSRNLIAPITSLKQAAVKLSRGDLSARAKLNPERQDELGVLGRDFNRMAEQLEQLISAQKRLLADISHELRSPLTRLKMATGLAQIQASEENQGYLLRIEKEANQLDKMIADVLKVSRLEAKSQALNLAKQPLQAIINEVLNDAKFEAKQSNKQLLVHGELNATLNCDESLIASALENVLRNAIKYAKHTITLTLSQNDAIHIEVCDDGKGVAPENLSKLCEPFFRQSHARDRNSGGTGLGLAIAKNAVVAHDGTLVLSNQAMGGLCVNITLPNNT